MTAAILLVAILPVSYLGSQALVKSVLYGYLVSLANILFAYYSIKWAFRKPSKIFYKVVLGGMGLRFFVLMLSLFIVWKFTDIPLIGYVVSLVGFYLALQFVEIRFIQKELKTRKATV
ncbi:MAG: hypothetical protein ACE5IR_01370 [bacterium]